MLAIYAILQYIGQRGVTVYFYKGVWRYLYQINWKFPRFFCVVKSLVWEFEVLNQLVYGKKNFYCYPCTYDSNVMQGISVSAYGHSTKATATTEKSN